jgi:hypothetical protein
MPSESLSQDVKVRAANTSGRPPTSLQVVRAGAPMGTQLPETNTAGLSDPYAGSVEMSVILGWTDDRIVPRRTA